MLLVEKFTHDSYTNFSHQDSCTSFLDHLPSVKADRLDKL